MMGTKEFNEHKKYQNLTTEELLELVNEDIKNSEERKKQFFEEAGISNKKSKSQV